MFPTPSSLIEIESMKKPEITTENGITFVSLGPDFDSIYENTLEELAELLEFVKAVDPPYLVMDLSHTQYCGSAFLGFLVRLSNRLRVERSGRFGVSNLSKYLQTVVSGARIDQIIDVFENRDDAAEAYASALSID